MTGSARRLLLVSNDEVGPHMAGPGIRYYQFARELAKQADVTLVVPNRPESPLGEFEVVERRPCAAGVSARLHGRSTW